MRFLLTGFVILTSLYSQAQDIILDKTPDSLSSLPGKDTIYMIAFTVKGTTIGGVPEVVILDDKGSAQKNIDYALLAGDSTSMDSLNIRAKNKTGKLLISIAGGLTEIRSIQLKVLIKDKNVNSTVQKSIGVRPWSKPLTKPAAPTVDSIAITLTKDEDVTVQGKKETIKMGWFHKVEKNAVVNIEKIEVQNTPDGKCNFIVLTADGDIYSTKEGISIKDGFGDSAQVFLNTDDRYSLKLKDFLLVRSEPKDSNRRLITPQNRTIKIVSTNQPKP